MKQRGKISKLRAKGCKESILWYQQHHELDESPGYVMCQLGHPIAFNEMTYAHQIGRPHIEPGIGESLVNGWCLCIRCHQRVDGDPKWKKELMEHGCNMENGRILEV